MQISLGSGSLCLLVNAVLLSTAAALVAVGCGGGSSDGGSSKAGASAGGDGDAGDSSTGGGSGGGGKGSAGKGNTNAGGPAGGEGGDMGEGGQAPVAQNHSAVAFVTGGVLSKSKNFVLISGTGESLGGNVGSKQAKSLKYTYIPGVIAASAR